MRFIVKKPKINENFLANNDYLIVYLNFMFLTCCPDMCGYSTFPSKILIFLIQFNLLLYYKLYTKKIVFKRRITQKEVLLKKMATLKKNLFLKLTKLISVLL